MDQEVLDWGDLAGVLGLGDLRDVAGVLGLGDRAGVLDLGDQAGECLVDVSMEFATSFPRAYPVSAVVGWHSAVLVDFVLLALPMHHLLFDLESRTDIHLLHY